MAQQLADHRQAFAQRQRARGKAMPEIMNAHVVETGACPDPTPRMLKVGEMGAGLPARDHPGIVLVAWQGLQQTHRRWRQRNRPAACLRVAQDRAGAADPVPPEPGDLGRPGADEQQEPDRGGVLPVVDGGMDAHGQPPLSDPSGTVRSRGTGQASTSNATRAGPRGSRPHAAEHTVKSAKTSETDMVCVRGHHPVA